MLNPLLAHTPVAGVEKFDAQHRSPPRRNSANLKDVYRERRHGIGWSRNGLLGIAKGDREAADRQSARNFKFFDAPVGLFVTPDTYQCCALLWI